MKISKYFGKELSWVRIGSYLITLKTPTSKPLFSERSGNKKPILKGLGYRLFVEKELKDES